MSEHPYSIKSLAERWGCSEAHVRGLIKSGKLRAFNLGGKLLRIASEEVHKWENPTTSSSGTEGSSLCLSSKVDNDSAARLARMTLPSRKRGSQNLSGSNRFKPQVVR